MTGFRSLLAKPLLWAASRFSSAPNRKRIFSALTALEDSIKNHPGKKGLVIPFEEKAGRFIIFSDQHMGKRNGADDFTPAEENYLLALEYYQQEDFYFINLGDSEELWENNIWQVKKWNKAVYEAEKKFLAQNRYVKVYGNHDLYWNTGLWAYWHLKSMYGEKVKVFEGVVLKTTVNSPQSIADSSRTNNVQGKVNMYPPGDPIHYSPLTILLTHGHQGDAQSDGNWFSKFFVTYVWAPLQSLLRINPNTPAYDNEKKTLHNHIMYEWSATRQNTILITGHTHQPVFASLTHLERLYKQLQLAQQRKEEEKIKRVKEEIEKREREFTAVSVDYLSMQPTYFNTGCCCFSDGDITGIEIADGCIRLIKWSGENGREVLEESELSGLVN